MEIWQRDSGPCGIGHVFIAVYASVFHKVQICQKSQQDAFGCQAARIEDADCLELFSQIANTGVFVHWTIRFGSVSFSLLAQSIQHIVPDK